ncbi:Hsp20/alpha crystallin family protein [Zooshikella harenae]|uniref:Hsp20/alpha crystallin family protein n=1 Tax=Zooshikella harenae TaxID=2827238 RepID=A0ABS5ZAX2_9GAMM|nr:Hsp20/alpha crystallin family protein [Zooshikella harenae]MBU2710446.1 Hsp20/alpha crystallin family protein [Zooshikella harenae]
MNLQKLNPWNWFKHEESQKTNEHVMPVTREAESKDMPVSSNNYKHYPIFQLHREIERLFDEAFRGFNLPNLDPSHFSTNSNSGLNPESFRPSLNVSSDDNGYQITLEAPGLTEKDIDIEIKRDIMTIQGSKQEEKENKDRHFYRIERHYGTFQRVLSLPEDANTDAIQAEMKNGVLKITIPRQESEITNKRKITIQSNR